MQQEAANQKLRFSYFTSTVSISLVIFLLGIVGLLLINTRQFSDYIKENISFSVVIKEKAKQVDVLKFQKNLDVSIFVKETRFISKEKAAEELRQELGEDFVELFGYNPLLPSIEVRLHAQYATPDSIAKIEQELLKSSLVKEVFYQKSLVHQINENVRKISSILVIFSMILLLIAIVLINNTVRLTVYSKRFLIRTEQLVGATQDFIRKPFLIQSAIQGTISALIAIFIMTALIYLLQQEFEGMVQIEGIVFLFFLLVLAGILISGISTYIAVNRYLSISSDDLYL